MIIQLTMVAICDRFQSYVSSLPRKYQRNIGFACNHPSPVWLHSFFLRRKLNVLAVQMVEQNCVDITAEQVAQHLHFFKSIINW